MPELTGTITVTNASVTVTGEGTNFLSGKVGRNDALIVDGGLYLVDNVASDTELKLKLPYTGTSGTGKAYSIVHLTGETYIQDLNRLLAELVQKYAAIARGVGVKPTPDGIPQAGADGKIDKGWVPMVDIPSSVTPKPDTLPLSDAQGKLDTGWLKASEASAAGNIPIAKDTGKLAPEWIDNTAQAAKDAEQDVKISEAVAKFADYLPLTGGEISGNLNVLGFLKEKGVSVLDIVEAGSNASGKYILLKNGTAIVYITNAFDFITSGDFPNGTFYPYSLKRRQTFPVTFSETPRLFVSFGNTKGYNILTNLLHDAAGYNFLTLNTANVSEYVETAYIFAIGKHA